MPRPTGLVGAVLAGGLSSRMGSDKALLAVHGRSMLQQQVDLLTPLCTMVLVSGDYPGFACVPDSVARCGPLGGIYSIALHCPNSPLLIIPVDMLHINSVQLAQLMQSSKACHYSAHPLPAFFPNSNTVVTAIQRIFATPELGFSVRGLHHALSSTAYTDSYFEPLNINTPEEWQNVT
jgi:molybdopterin-guanine dinucleotide biosynthesis protein A